MTYCLCCITLLGSDHLIFMGEGGGGRKTSPKKKSGCDFREVKSRKYQGVFEVKSRVKTWQVRGIWSQQLEHSPARRAGKTKNLRLASGSSFALQNLFSHSKIRFRSLKSAFRTPYLNCFTHSKNYIIYFGNDFSYYKKEVFRSLKKSILRW